MYICIQYHSEAMFTKVVFSLCNMWYYKWCQSYIGLKHTIFYYMLSLPGDNPSIPVWPTSTQTYLFGPHQPKHTYLAQIKLNIPVWPTSLARCCWINCWPCSPTPGTWPPDPWEPSAGPWYSGELCQAIGCSWKQTPVPSLKSYSFTCW